MQGKCLGESGAGKGVDETMLDTIMKLLKPSAPVDICKIISIVSIIIAPRQILWCTAQWVGLMRGLSAKGEVGPSSPRMQAPPH